jgi:anti-anti-sigma factor
MTAHEGRRLNLVSNPESPAVAGDLALGEFEFDLQLSTDATVASFSGEIDMATFSRFTGALSVLLNDGAPTLVLNLSQVRFISAAGLLALVEAIECARGEGVVVRIQGGHVVAYIAAVLGVSDTLADVTTARRIDHWPRHLRSLD